MSCRLAEVGDNVVAFVDFIVHPINLVDARRLLSRGFVRRPGRQSRGVDAVMIEYLLVHAKAEPWSRLYWMTEADNGFCRADGFVRYLIPVAG